MLEDTAEGFAHHKRVGMEVDEAGGLVAHQGELGELDVLGGKGHVDGQVQLGRSQGPVQVGVDQLAGPTQLPEQHQRIRK